MNVGYTAVALDEIEDILSYIAKDNEAAALRVSDAISATLDRLAEFPRMGVETDVEGVHMTLVLHYRYLIFFSVQNDTLIVRNVRHGRRQKLHLTKHS